MSDLVIVTDEGPVRTIRMNRPEKKNALTMAMYAFGTALCAISPNIGFLIAFRIIASLGIGLLLKSLVGVLFPIAGGIVYLLVTSQLLSAHAWKRLRPVSGIFLMLAIAVPNATAMGVQSTFDHPCARETAFAASAAAGATLTATAAIAPRVRKSRLFIPTPDAEMARLACR